MAKRKLTTEELQTELLKHVSAIGEYFLPHVEITLIIRNPKAIDGDLIISTEDDISAVVPCVYKAVEGDASS